MTTEVVLFWVVQSLVGLVVMILGAANILRNSGDAWRCGLGGTECIGAPIQTWSPSALSTDCRESSNCLWPWKQLMSWKDNPWTEAGYLDGKFKTFGYCGYNCPNGRCEDLDDATHTSHHDHTFGRINFTNNSYTTYLKVVYEERSGS